MPKRGETFRVGPWVGNCVLKTKYFVVMDRNYTIR